MLRIMQISWGFNIFPSQSKENLGIIMPYLTFLEFHGFDDAFNYFEGLPGVYHERTYQLSHFKDVTFLSQYKVEEVNIEDLPNKLKGEHPPSQKHWKIIRRKFASVNPDFYIVLIEVSVSKRNFLMDLEEFLLLRDDSGGLHVINDLVVNNHEGWEELRIFSQTWPLFSIEIPVEHWISFLIRDKHI